MGSRGAVLAVGVALLHLLGALAPSLAALAHFARRLDVTISELLRGV